MFAEGFSILRLALLALKWIIFHRFVLLWHREHCGYIFHRAFFFSGVEHLVAKITAVPCSSLVWPTRWNRHYRPLHFWAVCFSEVNLCSVILWRWDFCGEFCDGAFFSFGIENPVPEITVAPCTSLALGISKVNSTMPVYQKHQSQDLQTSASAGS